MSGQSDKKNRKSNQQSNKLLLLSIAICLGINIFITLLKYLIKGTPITTKQIIGLCILNILNYFLFKLINGFRGSYWEGYLVDFFGLNLAIEVLIPFHYKFWYLYLIYPGAFCWWGGKKLFAYVSTIGKEDPAAMEMEQMKQKKEQKQKVKYVKAK